MLRSNSAPSRLEHDVHIRRAVRECRCIGEYQYHMRSALYPRHGGPPPPIPRPLPDLLPPPPLPEAEPDLHPTQEFEVFVDCTPTPEPPPLPEPDDLPSRPTRPTPGAPVFTPDPPIAPYNPWDQALMQPQGAHGALRRGAQ